MKALIINLDAYYLQPIMQSLLILGYEFKQIHFFDNPPYQTFIQHLKMNHVHDEKFDLVIVNVNHPNLQSMCIQHFKESGNVVSFPPIPHDDVRVLYPFSYNERLFKWMTSERYTAIQFNVPCASHTTIGNIIMPQIRDIFETYFNEQVDFEIKNDSVNGHTSIMSFDLGELEITGTQSPPYGIGIKNNGIVTNVFDYGIPEISNAILNREKPGNLTVKFESDGKTN